ncbi:hypothetical protein TWF696_003014 [Orbilia brochopaga]|uniref:Uncharacterized protein n=1 Tax=Orbilia brochopaga TaxID=3140254 RepID=A0AAV9U1G0_9PEZI
MRSEFSCIAALWQPLLWGSLLPLLDLITLTAAQETTVTETSSTTKMVMVTEVIYSTTVTTLPSCGCPCSTFAVGPVFTSTITPSSVPDASAVALQLFVSPTPASEPESFFVNVEGNSAVTSDSPFLFYLNENGEYADAADLSQLLFLYLTSAIGVKRSLAARQDIFGFYPVFYGDPFPGTTTNTWFINDDGVVNLDYTWPNGTSVTYEFALCRVNGLIATQIYMHEIDVPYPPQCYPADVFQIPFSKLASLTSTTSSEPTPEPTPTETSNTTTTTESSSNSETNTGSNTNTGSSSSPSNTGTGTSNTGTTGGGSTGTPTDPGPTETPTPPATGTTTVTVYTETVLPGFTSTQLNTDGPGSPTLTLYLPYPSSLKVLGYTQDNVDPGLLDSFFNSDFIPIGGIEGDGRVGYRLFVLTPEGWLMDPISAPLENNGAWTGGGSLLDSPKYVYAYSDTSDGQSFNHVGVDDMSTIESSNGKLLTFRVYEGILYPNFSANVTLTEGLWLCSADSTEVGFGDGSDSCGYASLSSIALQGYQTTITAVETGYAFVTAATTTVISNGQGPTATVVSVLPRGLATETVQITSGTAGYQTVGTGLNDPTATVILNQFVISTTTTDWGRTTGGPLTSTVTTDPLTLQLEVHLPYPTPVAIGDAFSHNLYVNQDPPQLWVYGETEVTPLDGFSLFLLIDTKLALIVVDVGTSNTFYGDEPAFAYLQNADQKVYFYTPTAAATVGGLTLLGWQLNTDANTGKDFLFLDAATQQNYAGQIFVACDVNNGVDSSVLTLQGDPIPAGCQAYGTQDTTGVFLFYYNGTVN